MSGRIGRIGDWNNGGGNSSGSSNRSGSSRRIATFSDFAGGASSGGPGIPPMHHDDEDDDEEQDPQNRRETWFAGGERSGVAIQNPDRDGPGGSASNIIRDLIEQARQGGVYQPPEPPAHRFFTGGGHTLGSDEVESQFIPDPNAGNQDEEEVVRHLHLWRDGFSVEDGPLMSYTEDHETLTLIRAGMEHSRAPPEIMNVAFNQPVQLVIAQREHEDYIPPKRGAFSGTGNRLGAPTPTAAQPQAPIPGAFPSAPTSSSLPSLSVTEPERMTTRFEVDQTKPMTSVQVRLADGTRIVARVNLTHTVGDLRNFINASRPGTSARPYTISTPVPQRILDNDKQTIEEAGLKNSVVVQRWSDA
ncbi:ubiquitin-related domain-containing protein [Vararia minispora EC-137]|uniref:Ubiquitin-related domain-containing protein n=1 Tax=Vararia minispora EC-137 TaxID=1314806 RepID=A0ACB8QP76_9AGAM|nr:ubiquitin-related domain-containing protein [Vararia minispora EC-137]